MEIRLTQGQVTVIDDKHADLAALSWYAVKGKHKKTFYAARHVPQRPDGGRPLELLHQVIARRMGIIGPPDHIDRDGLNNRETNLRPASDSQNQANKGLQANSTSGYKGVSFYKVSGEWKAYVRINGKQRHLGYFADPIEAAKAYDRAALEAFGEFALINFPATQPLQI